MRTTILLPDELYDQVRRTAAGERRTVTSLIEEALRHALAARAATHAPPHYRVDVIHNGGGLLEGVDLYDGAALADLMDDL